MLNLCFVSQSQSQSQSNLKMIHTKKPRTRISRKPDLFDLLPDDLIVHLLCKLSSSASSPADLFNILLTCKRLNQLGIHPLVLSKAGPKAFSIKTKNWSDSAHHFLKRCVDAGNSEASFVLGMIRFYCLKNRGSGASLMAKAAIKSHAPALYSLAVIQFNGSGGSKTDKDLKAGVALCARAAFLGHVDALRELGHCLQDGYGVRQNTGEGRRLLLQANAREVASILRASTRIWRNENVLIRDVAEAETERHPVNVFLREWFEKGRGSGSGSGSEEGLRLCSHGGCGRVETRPHEFRRCSICGMVNYCSRGCQALHWKIRHKIECQPFGQWLVAAAVEEEEDGGGAGMEDVEVEGNNVGTV